MRVLTCVCTEVSLQVSSFFFLLYEVWWGGLFPRKHYLGASPGTITRVLEDAASSRENNFFVDCCCIEFQEDVYMVCGQVQLGCVTISASALESSVVSVAAVNPC